mgnify:CR=1 FL=1
MKAYERLLNYVKILTPSNENSQTVPSSDCQFNLARILEKEMNKLGLTDVYLDDKCYLYGKLPATKGYENCPAIGFIAHMDTVSDFCDHSIHPILTKNYNGEALPLGDSGLVLDPKVFPHLSSLKGRTLITSDGTTILGADDKAGIAEILTMVERLISKEIPHGPISIAFTPDEEIGSGAEYFDIKRFDADFAYTLDGDTEGEIQFENFNACKAEFEITGFNVHPGSSKDTMINASLVAMEINSCLPSMETPRNTEDYEGFYHLIGIQGDVEQSTVSYIIRDHDRAKFENRKKEIERLVAQMNAEYGAGTATLELRDQYYNMREKIEPVMHIIDTAFAAMEAVGVKPNVKPIRGGTDGAQLSFKGLPCPNIFAGGLNFHGRYEFVPIQNMEKAMKVIVKIAELVASK